MLTYGDKSTLSLKANGMIHSLFIFLVGAIENAKLKRQLLVSVSGHRPALTPAHEVQMRSEVVEGNFSLSQRTDTKNSISCWFYLFVCFYFVVPPTNRHMHAFNINQICESAEAYLKQRECSLSCSRILSQKQTLLLNNQKPFSHMI